MSSFATIRSSQGSAVGMQAPHKLKKGEAVLLPLPPHLLEKGEVALPLPPHLLKKLLEPKLKIRYRRTLNQSSDTFESFVEEKSPVPIQKPRNQAGLQEMSYASIVASSTAQSNTLVPQQKLRHRKTLNMPKSARDQIKLSVSPLKQRHRKTFVQQVKSCDVLNSQNFPQDMDWQISTQKGPKLHTKQTEIPVDESYYSALSSDDICDTELPNTPVSNLIESNNAQRKQKRVKTKHSSKASVHQILPQTPVKPLPVVEPVTNDPIQDDMHQYVLDLQNFCPDIRVETQNGVEVIISNAQQQRLWCFSQNDEQQFFVDDIGFTLWRTPADGACLFHALVLVLSHWELTAKQYQNVITLRETIWKVLDKLNKKNDPWLLELFNTFTDLKTEPERNNYIQDIRRPKTWGSRIEIMMFCLLYDCEIKIAHAVEGERFSFDSTRDALQLIKTKIPRLNMPYFKNTIRLNKNPGYNIKRIGYIGSVFSNNPFALDERIPKNHFVFLRHQNSTFDFFRNLEKSRRISIVHNLGLCLEFEGAKALKDILLETKKRKFTKISLLPRPAQIRPRSKYALKQQNISRNRKSALNKGSNLENSDTRPLSQVWDELDPNQPLHLNQHVINAMEEARDKMQALKPPSPPCTHCHRWWPDMEIKIKQPTIDTDDECEPEFICKDCDNTLEFEHFCIFCAKERLTNPDIFCDDCSNTVKTLPPAKFSVFNGMHRGHLPKVMLHVTPIEEMLIQLVSPFIRVIRRTQNRNIYTSHVINIPQDLSHVEESLHDPHHVLPRPLHELPMIWMQRIGKNDSIQMAHINRDRVRAILIWLKANNPLYEHIEISEKNLALIPEDGILESKHFKNINIAVTPEHLPNDFMDASDSETESSATEIEDKSDEQNAQKVYDPNDDDLQSIEDNIITSKKDADEHIDEKHFEPNDGDLKSIHDNITTSKKDVNKTSKSTTNKPCCDKAGTYSQFTHFHDTQVCLAIQFIEHKNKVGSDVEMSDEEPDNECLDQHIEYKNNTKPSLLKVRHRTTMNTNKHWFSNIGLSCTDMSDDASNNSSPDFELPESKTLVHELETSEHLLSIYPDPLEGPGFEGENLDESDHVILGKRKASHIASDDSKTHIVDLSNSDNTLPIYPDPLEGSGYEGDNLDESDLVILGKRKALSFESDEISEDPKSQPLLTPRKGCRPGFIPLFTRKVYAKKALAAAEAYEHEQAIEKIRNVINTIRNSDDSNNDVGDKSNDEANPHQESTTHESFLPSPIYENIPELEKVKKHIFGSYKNPAKWPKRDEHGINEFTQKYLLAACFPTLFPYGVGDFTGNLPIPVSIDQARKYYEKYAEYNSETETIEYPFAQHPFFSFYMLNRAHRHTLLSASNVFLRNSPSYNNMTIEQLLDHIKNHTKSLLAMGIGRYEANAKGSAGFWHIAGQELKAAINEICFPTLFYSFSFADNWNTELFNILPFPKGMSRDSYNDRKKVLTNNLHLAAWFYYRKATEFSIQMRKVLQAEWYWERVEAQFRTTLHTHGCLKMRNDNELLQNTHKALLGKLAQERVEHLRNGLSIEPTVAPLLPENTFAEHLTANAKLKQKDTIREVLKNFIADYATHKKRNFCYYYGVAFEQDNENLEKVLSGKQEKQTCKKQGMLEPEILHVINDLDPIDAYTIESEVITYLQLYANKNTLNKSAVFGLGNRPRNWRNLKCTLTLLRGTYRATRYRAYPELDDLFDSCKTDRQLIIELNKFILDGKRAEDEVCRFVDYFISTMNPLYSDDNDEAIPNLPYFDRQRCCKEHPCAQAYRNPFDYVVKPNGPTLEALRNADFGKLVARTQRPHDCSKGGCRRVDRKSKQESCRFHFPHPKELITRIEFKAHGKNMFGDTIWRASIVTKRNDTLLNNYVRCFLNNWRANMDFQIIMDPVACAQYIAKYTAKAEKKSRAHVAFMKDILQNASEDDRPLDVIRKMMLRGEKERDLGKPEIHYLNLGLPLISTNIRFTSCSLTGRRQLKSDLDFNNSEYVKRENATWISLRDFYANRHDVLFDKKCLELIGNDLDTMNFDRFVTLFNCSRNRIFARPNYEKMKKYFVVRFYPDKKPFGVGSDYPLYCKFQLIRFKAWRNDPKELWAEFMPDDYDAKDRVCFEVVAYPKAYQDWLDSPAAVNCLKKQKLQRDLEQATLAHRIWTENDNALYDPDVAAQPDPGLKPPDWMQMSSFADMMDFTSNLESCAREQPWDAFMKPLSEIDRERCKTHLKELIQADEYRATIPIISRDTLNTEQKLGYDIICKHFTEKTEKPLYLLLHGTAGTGKTHIIQALKNVLGESIFLTALTGKAASIFFGIITHSLINLPIHHKMDLSSERTVILQERFTTFSEAPQNCYIVIDEISLCGTRQLYWIDRRLRQAFNRMDIPFGGCSLIFVGDFGQLPPIRDRPLYDNATAYFEQHVGRKLFTEFFTTIVMLHKNMRIDPDEFEFGEVLLRVRDGITTPADMDYFKPQFESVLPNTPEFEKAVHLYYGRTPCNKRNIEMLYALDSPIFRLNAEFTGGSIAKTASLIDTQQLVPQLQLAIGAEILITKNIYQRGGLINGTAGTIWEVIYAIGKAPPDLPISILVHIPTFKGESFVSDTPGIVAITPSLVNYDIGDSAVPCTIRQYPLMLAYALTIHKSEGSTLTRAYVDIGKREPPSAPGLAFVALSRCRNVKHYRFADWSITRLNQVSRSSYLAKRMIDCNRLEYLFQDTKYDFSDQTIPRDFSRIVDLTPFEKLLKDKNKNNKPSTKFRSNATVLFTHPPRLKKSYHYTNLDTLANTFLSGTGTAVRTDSSSSNSKKLARGRKIRKRSKRQKLSQVSNDFDSILQNNSSVESAIRVQQIDTSNLKKRRRKTFRT